MGIRTILLFEMHIKREINKQTIQKVMTGKSEKEERHGENVSCECTQNRLRCFLDYHNRLYRLVKNRKSIYEHLSHIIPENIAHSSHGTEVFALAFFLVFFLRIFLFLSFLIY